MGRLDPLGLPGSFAVEESDIPPELTIAEYRAQRRQQQQQQEVEVITKVHLRRRELAAIALVVAAAALVALLVFVEPALAETSDIGKNVGKEINTWAVSIFLGLALFAGLKTFANRNIGEALVLAFLVVVIGGFVLAPSEVKSMIKELWGSFSG